MERNRYLSWIFLIGVALITIFCAFSTTIRSADADVKYLRVVNDTTPIYSDKDCTDIIFNLSYTYYVKLLETDGEIARVECYGNDGLNVIDGYVFLSSLYDDGLDVSSPYPSLTVETRSACSMYLDKELTTVRRYLFKDRKLQYYGRLENEKGYLYCVGYNGDLGYVEEQFLYSFTLANHPNDLTFIKPTSPDNEGVSSTTNDFLSLKIIIIVCLVFAGLLALTFALKKGKSRAVKTEYYDENDYS